MNTIERMRKLLKSCDSCKYYELNEILRKAAKKSKAIDELMYNICGDGYDADARAYRIIKAFCSELVPEYKHCIIVDEKGRKHECLYDKSRMLIYTASITYEALNHIGYKLEEE